MIECYLDTPWQVHERPDGELRLEFPASAVDGYVAHSRTELDQIARSEQRRLLEVAVASAEIGPLIDQLQRHAHTACPQLPLRLDVARGIVTFPAGEMLLASYALSFLRAWAEAVQSGERAALDSHNYGPHLAHVQQMILQLALKNAG
jgi:hypothetical protein